MTMIECPGCHTRFHSTEFLRAEQQRIENDPRTQLARELAEVTEATQQLTDCLRDVVVTVNGKNWSA